MNRYFACLVLAVTSCALGQGIRFDSNATQAATNVPSGASANVMTVPRALITVCGFPAVPASGSPCTNTVTVYQDQATTQPLTQPINADVLGRFGFWATPNTYSFSVQTQGEKYVGTWNLTLTSPPGPQGPSGIGCGTGNCLVTNPGAAQNIAQPGNTNLGINTLNGTTHPGFGWSSIQAAVTAAQAIDGSVEVPATFSAGEMSAPGVGITNSEIATGNYTNYVAPIVEDKRPFNHDTSLAQALSLPSLDGMNEGGDMTAFSKCVQAGSCKIAIIGNSIHECNSGIAPDDSYCDPLFDAFKRKFPSVAFTFINLSIGGTSISNLNDPNYKCDASGTPFFRAPANSFYNIDPVFLAGGPLHQWPNGCVVGESWMQHIVDFVPDIAILGFVENTQAFDQGPLVSGIFAAMNTIHAIGSTPATIILTTDEPPNPNWCSLICPVPGQFEGLNEGVRGLALQTGTLLADADRYYNVLTYGIDPARRHYQLEFGLPTYPTNWSVQAPFSGSMPAIANIGTQNVTLTIAGGNASMVHEARSAVDYTTSATFSSVSTSGVPSIWYRMDNAGLSIGYNAQASHAATPGVWTIQLFFTRAVGNQVLLQQGSCTTTPGSALTLTVKVVGSHHEVWCNSTIHAIDVFDGNINNGGEFAIGIQNGTGVISRQYTYFGNPSMDFTPLVNIQSMLGTQVPPTYIGTGDFNTNIFSRAGDGLHHPSALGMDSYYLASFKPVLDQLALAIPQHSFQVEHKGLTGRYGGLQDSTAGEVDFVNGPNGGRISNNANNQVLETWDNTTTNPHIFMRPIQVNGGWNITNTNLLPSVGSPTVGRAACIKAAGPPVVIGFCSTVVDASGACTCN